MNMKKTTQQRKRVSTFVDDNPVEAKRNVVSAAGSSLVNDFVKPAPKDFWDQILGVGRYEASSKGENLRGDIEEGEELDLRSLERQIAKTEEAIEKAAPAIDYHREVIKSTEVIAKENTFVLQRRIEEIILELRKLAKSSQELQVTFRELTVETAPVSPGRYHLNFFEWILAMVRSTRLKIEDSKTWLTLFASKKTKRSYWAMFKKHGTTFGLSHERVVATQTG